MKLTASGGCVNAGLRTSTALLLLWGLWTPVASAQESVELSVDLTQQVTLHEPIVFSYTLTNVSNSDKRVTAGRDRIGAFEFAVDGPDRRRQVFRYDGAEGGSRTDPFVVRQGRGYSQVVALGSWIDFSRVGTYSVAVRFLGGVVAGEESARMGILLINEATLRFNVQVLPRDAARLRATCERLYADSWKLNVQDALDAKQQLGTSKDVIAIPYLESLLEAKRAEVFLVMAEIGGPEARAALERLAASEDIQTSRAAAETLKRIK